LAGEELIREKLIGKENVGEELIREELLEKSSSGRS
jgi:hypothetical protein